MSQPLFFRKCSPAVPSPFICRPAILKPFVYKACRALIENEQRTRQAVRGIKDMFRKDGIAK
ncbi:hypothetical protein FQ179_21155 [Pusillimonas sp. ANT_WB101]|nr:hypothetical protein FQ179_21155 [Pusillimonas sp. ANT_WB101]